MRTSPLTRLSLTVLLAVTPFLLAAANPDDSADWSMFRGNIRQTGVAKTALPARPEVLWKFDVNAGDEKGNDSIESTAAVVNGVVYFGTLDGLLYALDLQSGKLKWKTQLAKWGIKAAPTVVGERIYVGDEEGAFHAVDTRSGKELWKFEAEAEIISSATVVDDRILFGSYDARLYCLGTDGKLKWQFETDGNVHATPAVADGKTFVTGCDGFLRVIDVEQGKETGSVNLESYTGASPALVDHFAYVGTIDGEILGVDWQGQTVVWRFGDPERQMSFLSSAAVTEELVVLGGRDRLVRALDRATGKVRWTFATKGRMDSSPVIVGKRVFVSSEDGNLYALDLATGRQLWKFPAGSEFLASPAVAAGRLVIGTADGVVYCFGERQTR